MLGVNETRQKVDLFFRLAPGARCPTHRHVGPTDTLVIEGEHRTWALGPDGWQLDQIRPPGFFASNEGDHLHSEQGGAEGAIVLLSMVAVEGVIWEVLDDDGNVVAEATLEEFARALSRQGAPDAERGPGRPRLRSGLILLGAFCLNGLDSPAGGGPMVECMTSIELTIPIDASPGTAWEAVRDFGAVHERLVPGFLTACHPDGEDRVVTFFNGAVARERLVTLDDDRRRLVYSVIDSAIGLTLHQASVEVVAATDDDGRAGTAIRWVADFLPPELEPTIRSMMETAADTMRRAFASADERGLNRAAGSTPRRGAGRRGGRAGGDQPGADLTQRLRRRERRAGAR